jgi:hypothetical protein
MLSKSAPMAQTSGLRCFPPRALFEDERTHSKQGWTGEGDPEQPSPSVLSKLQNRRSVMHRTLAPKMFRFFRLLGLERNP